MVSRAVLHTIPLLVLTASFGLAAEPKITVDPADFKRINVPMTVSIDGTDLKPGAVELVAEDGNARLAQMSVEGPGRGSVVRWVEPDLPAGQRRIFAVRPMTRVADPFRFSEGDGWRDLLHADRPVWRDMLKYDPADHSNTFKPFRHVYQANGKGFITKGAGGKYTHHRGIFFGFKAGAGDRPLGDFWHCPDVTQRHVRYVAEAEFVGPVAARSHEIIHWVGKDGQTPVVQDTRTTTTWHVDDNHCILDYDITVESMLEQPLKLFADAHHGGFHFRAAQEIADAPGADGKPGAAVYTRPAAARHVGNDIWSDCGWVECAFKVGERDYRVTLLNHPSNPTPTTFSTRPYGRFGAYFESTLVPGEKLQLKYRLLLRSGETHESPASVRVQEAELAWCAFAAAP